MNSSSSSADADFHLNLLERVLQRRRQVIKSRTDLFWSTVFFFTALALYYEMSFGHFVLLWSDNDAYYSASAATVICFCAFVVYILRYLSYRLLSTPVELTVVQQQLFGVFDFEPGFRILRPVVIDQSLARATPGPNYSPSVYTGRHPFQCSPSRSLLRYDQSFSPNTGTGIFSNSSMFSPRQGSIHSTPPSSFSAGVSSFNAGTSGYMRRASDGRSSPSACPSRLDATTGSFSTSFNSSSLPLNQSPSPVTMSGNTLAATLQHDLLAEMTGTRGKSRRASQSPTVSPLRTDNCIQDIATLDHFLREQQERESKPTNADVTPCTSPGSSSFWSYVRSATDLIPALRQYQYQLAPRSLQSTTSSDDPTSRLDSPSCELVWTKLGVTSDQVDRWVENLRKWLHKTILSRLVCEIDEINKLLVRLGSDDVQIGEASLTTLKQLSAVKSQHVPQLASVLSYIDMVPNQEYLIHRIRELANGGCISAFKWNGGSEFKGKRWDDTLPTDSAILIHLLCSYLDARLPGHPKYPDGKTFTSQHFIKTPDKPNLVDRKDNLSIYQTRVNPPHFKVVIGDTIWNIKEGRHNLFHSILVFLHHIKTKEHGMLRRINLGMSGINIAWIFDQ